jgi:hypothetical protein
MRNKHAQKCPRWSSAKSNFFNFFFFFRKKNESAMQKCEKKRVGHQSQEWSRSVLEGRKPAKDPYLYQNKEKTKGAVFVTGHN